MRTTRAVIASLVLSLVAGTAAAEPIFGITSTTTFNFPALVSFDSATPNVMSNPIAISGLVGGQTLRGIDFRPANGQLYAVSSSGANAQLYRVNTATGVLTPVGSGFTLTGNTSSQIAIDFNPVADRLRIVTGDGQSYRVNPIDGTLAAQDTSLPSPNGANGVLMSGLAYSNNVAGAATTTLYGYDYLADALDTIGGLNGAPSPNLGQVFNVGSSGISSDLEVGFDISGVTGIAYLSAFDFLSGGTNALYRVDLATGALTFIGFEALALRDIAVRVAAIPEPGSIALLGLGLAGLALSARRRAKR